MKRFIDLRNQNTGYDFAWWDTISECFDCRKGNYAWRSWIEFEADYTGIEIERYESLCPEWVFHLTPT